MFNTFLFCVAIVQAIQAHLTSESSNGRLQEMNSATNNAGWYNYPSFLSKVKESALAVPGSLARSELMRLDTGAAEEDVLEDYSLLDPQALSLEVSSREERSPRRCVQLLESCVGHVPCCSPCATCYCRFFNAFCYCRKTGHNCHQGHVPLKHSKNMFGCTYGDQARKCITAFREATRNTEEKYKHLHEITAIATPLKTVKSDKEVVDAIEKYCYKYTLATLMGNYIDYKLDSK